MTEAIADFRGGVFDCTDSLTGRPMVLWSGIIRIEEDPVSGEQVFSEHLWLTFDALEGELWEVRQYRPDRDDPDQLWCCRGNDSRGRTYDRVWGRVVVVDDCVQRPWE